MIPGYLIAGAYPRPKNLKSILDSGVTRFVCLMQDHEIKRQGDYFTDFVKKKTKNPDIYSFVHVPIPGGHKL